MKNNSKLGTFIIAATSFCGGVAAGFLLAPDKGEKHRKWIASRTQDLSHWLNNNSRKITDKSSEELHRLRNHIQQGVRDNIPDLYEATEKIPLNGDDVWNG